MSCRTYKPQVITTNDSIAIKEIVRDSIITIPPDSAWLYAWLECDSAGNVLLKELEQVQVDRLKMEKFSLERDSTGVAKLRMLAIVESLKAEIEIKDKLIEQLKTNSVLVEAQIPPFKRFLMWTGAIAIIFVIAVIFVKLR